MTATESHDIPPEIKAAMEEAVRYAVTGKADPSTLRRIREDADRVREEVFRKHGVLDIGVPAIRELRDSEE
jgi:hypothetical protein